jgi:hypothetical protein
VTRQSVGWSGRPPLSLCRPDSQRSNKGPYMSFSTLFFIIACIGIYKLGVYNAKHPGAMMEHGHAVWKWLRT